MIFILNRAEEIVGVLNNQGDVSKITPYYEDTFTEDLNTGSSTFEFRTLGGTQEAYHLQVGNFVAFKDDKDFQVFQITEVEDEHTDTLEKRVYCEGICLELLNDVIRPVEMQSVNIRQYLTTILNGTSWSVGMIDVALNGSHSIDITDYDNVYKALQDGAIGKFGAELRFRVEIQNNRIVARYIDAFAQRGRVTKHRFEYGRNMTKVTKKVDTSELCTALIGVGKNDVTFKTVEADDKPLNQDFIISQDAYDRWNVKGKHLMGVFKYDTESPEELLLHTRKELKRRSEPKVTYELDVELLGEDVRLGDEVFVIDTDFSPMMLLSARVSVLEKTKTNGDNKCKLANFKEVRSNITDDMRSIALELEGKLDEKLNSKFPVGTNDIKDDAITSDKIGNSQIYGSHIYADQISTKHLQADSVDATKIQADAINSKHIDAEAIQTEHLTTNIISGDKVYIEDGYIKSSMIGNAQIESANIGTAQIESAHIKSGQIDTIHIVEGAIETANIKDGNITSAKIGKAQITSAHIKELSADVLTSGTINSELINVTNINASNITTGSIDASVIGVKNLNADSLTSGTIDASKIGVTNLNASNIVSGSIDASKIKVSNLSADSIVSGILDASKITVSNLSADSLTSGTIDATNIQVLNLSASGITTGILDASKVDVTNLNASHIVTGSLDASKINVTNLNADNITSGAISSDRLNVKDGFIKSAMIGSGQIGSAHIVDGAISGAKISKATITDAEIKDATITSAKIKEINASKVTSGTIDTSKITVSGLNGKLKISNNRLQVFDAQTTPIERVSIGDVNADGSLYGLRVRGKDGKTVLYDENGVYSEGITDGAITNPKIANESITGDKLVIDSIFANEGFIGALSTVSIHADQIQTGKISGDRIDLEGLLSFATMDKDLKDKFIYDEASGKTFINGDSIFTNSVTAKKINAKGLSVRDNTDRVTFNISDNGDTQVKGTVSSFEFSNVKGQEKGYLLTPEGDAFLNNATVRGSVILPDGGVTNYSKDSLGVNLLRDADKFATSEDMQIRTLIDEKMLRGKTITTSVEFDFENISNKEGASNRLGYEMSINFEDGTNMYVNMWHYVSEGTTFKGRKSHTQTIPDKPIKSIGYSGLYIQCNGSKIKVGRPKIELGDKATSWEADVNITNPVRFWSGTDYYNRDNAPFRVLQDGTVIATRGDFKGTVTGSIDIGNIKIEDTNETNGSITLSSNNNAKEVIKFNEGLSFIDTDLVVGNVNDKMVEFDRGNNNVNIHTNINANLGKGSVKILNTSNDTNLLEFGYTGGTFGNYHHHVYYEGGCLVNLSTGAVGDDYPDYKFTNNTSDVKVSVDGELKVKDKIVVNNNVEMIARNGGFDFVIK